MSSHVLPIPDGDAILIERLPSGLQRIYRTSGRPIGELIPISMDPSEGLLELITVEGTLVPPPVVPVRAETNDHTFTSGEPLSLSHTEMPTHVVSTGSIPHPNQEQSHG